MDKPDNTNDILAILIALALTAAALKYFVLNNEQPQSRPQQSAQVYQPPRL